MNDLGGNFLFDNFTKQAVGIHIHSKTPPGTLKRAVKAAMCTGMARRSCLVDLQKQSILVAVIQNFAHTLNMT
jgi:hypothetical protein